tara:strand:- start:143 stop:349 length:207 start_codon:yes stop_codon:yes gene_type:complete
MFCIVARKGNYKGGFKSYTPEQEQAIIEYYLLTGESYIAIGKVMGVREHIVTGIIDRYFKNLKKKKDE